MGLIINLDTATDTASVCITDNGRSIFTIKNENQKEHASFIHTGIKTALEEVDLEISNIDAFAVTAGPGSYTGLRVGMATAKGFCYALSKPLITVSTLEAMAIAAIIATDAEDILYCPMIDARRMEVFTAVYDNELKKILAPTALVLEEGSFNNFTTLGKIMFFGTGSLKYATIEKKANAFFNTIDFSAEHVGIVAEKAFKQQDFSNLSVAEPAYLKEFYSATKQINM
ncbi:MAG TPA: tRNA (adenosine(37)-N6)-threonylcarbamoyltransferase complex dimerization subunit type 1 TsaB [Segetibacter sp.]